MDRGAWRAAVHVVARVGHDWATKHSDIVVTLTTRGSPAPVHPGLISTLCWLSPAKSTPSLGVSWDPCTLSLWAVAVAYMSPLSSSAARCVSLLMLRVPLEHGPGLPPSVLCQVRVIWYICESWRWHLFGPRLCFLNLGLCPKLAWSPPAPLALLCFLVTTVNMYWGLTVCPELLLSVCQRWGNLDPVGL